MRVGVCLSGFTPDVGGGYTFQTDVYAAFARLAASSSHRFVVLCDTLAIHAMASAMDAPANCEFVQIRPPGLRDRVARIAVSLVPQARSRLSTWGRVERTCAEHSVDMLWYVGGGPQEIVDRPYIATVWDIQHRTHSWLPEVSEKGIWENREISNRHFLARAWRVITGTETGAQELGFYYQVPRERIALLPHPTPAFALQAQSESVSDPRPRYGIEGDYFLYPAQFWPHKNHVTLLHALSLLASEFDYRPSLILVGSDKGNRSFLLEQARALGVEAQLKFPGFIPVEDLIAFYRYAVALAYVSMSGPENLPPLEAFALDCPVLASDIPGASEQLGDCAVLVQPFDVPAIAAAMNELRRDQELHHRLTHAGRSRAGRWTADDYVAKVFQMLDEFAPVRRNWP